MATHPVKVNTAAAASLRTSPIPSLQEIKEEEKLCAELTDR
ncbi:hypothetical protein [Eleftheria terrae]|nr:hypothetical protein [Eleftheria terrae]WKB56043.1 hypothetical protein N7L95_28695 [Eleftheria terrae]